MLMRRLLAVLLVVVCGACPGGDDGPVLPVLELAPAHVGEAYRVEFAPTGGTAPLSFSVEGIPPGFSFFTAEGVLEGTPRAPGGWGLRVSVTDARGRTDARTYTLELLPERAPGDDAGTDAGSDAGTDAGSDAGTDAGSDAGTDAGSDAGTDAGSDAGTDAGVPAYLTIANWNLEWFGDLNEGPSDETLQLNNAARVISDLDADIWGLAEIVSESAFNQLLAETSTRSATTYRGLLASASSVSGGSGAYSFAEQKVALIWKEGVLSNVSAEIILSAHDYAFAGRPPLKVEATANIDGVSVPVTFVVLHMKASANQEALDRRREAGLALKAWLDALPSNREVMVLGDWNDDVDQSIVSPFDTPYRALLDSPRYEFLTEVLSLNGISTSVSFPTPIDHQLVTASLATRHVAGSTLVEHPSIAGYGYTTSDHYPVHSTFLMGMGDGSSGGSDGGTDAGSDGGTDAGTDGGTGCTAPRVLINEVFPNPGTLSDGGTDWDQNYVELYNPGSTAVSMQGWELHDYDSAFFGDPVRHVFGATVLPAGGALVIFAGPRGVASHPGIAYELASSGTFRFNRGYRATLGFIDAAVLLDASGALVDHAIYSTTSVEVANNRSPDGQDCAETLELHPQLGAVRKSPGRRADGGAF